MLNHRKIIMIAILFIAGSFNLAYAYSDEEKATIFNRVMEAPIWIEYTITVKNSDLEEAGKFARNLSPIEARQKFLGRIVQTEELGLTRDIIGFSGLITIAEEDTTGNYGKPFIIEENGNKIEKVTFRFKMQCERINEINPFIKKVPYQKRAIINYATEYDDYWEIRNPLVSGHWNKTILRSQRAFKVKASGILFCVYGKHQSLAVDGTPQKWGAICIAEVRALR